MTANIIRVATERVTADERAVTLASHVAELEERLAESELYNNTRVLRSRIERLERDITTYREARETADFTAVDLRQALEQSTASIEAVKASPTFRLGALLIEVGRDWRLIGRLPGAISRWSRESRRQQEDSEKLLVANGSVTEYTAAAERALEVAEKRGLQEAKRWISDQHLRDSVAARALSDLASYARKIDLNEAVRLAEAALQADPHENRVKRLAFLMAESGSVTEAAQLLRSAIGKGARFNAAEEARGQELLAMADLASTGLVFASKRRWAPSVGSANRRVLILASQAFPYHWSSLSMRTHAVAESLTQADVLVDVVTVPGYPDVGSAERTDRPSSRKVDGIDYHLLPSVKARPGITNDYVQQASLALISFMRRLRTTVLIAPLELMQSYPAVVAAQKLGVPLLLDCWSVSPGEDQCRTERGRILSRTEDALLHYAQAALARTPAIADRLGLVPRGPKVYLDTDDTPGGISTEPSSTSSENGEFVFGYVGDNSPDIDLESLIDLLKGLVEAGLEARLTIHSVGTRIQTVRDQLELAGLGQRVSVVLKSPPGRRAALAYRGVDVIVVPFAPEEEAVKSPYQIVAALRHGKCVIVVGGESYRDLFGSAVVWAEHTRSAIDSLKAFALQGERRRTQEAEARAWDAAHPSGKALVTAVESL
ncbi:glycosyltransferase [Mesorhizobium sophorae]|uniref:glycosyltransferase n=1 Tax=Mesorhizobium sophorae TaxID=1300294 RepID=UPI000BA35E31|nr:glycosyltransferase [Mesorhizobium sophorae]